MSRKRIVVIAALLGVVMLGGVGAVSLWQYHEQPEFCATCHIMDPYLESWQSSDYGAAAHAEQGVACLDCHEPTIQQQMDELMVYVQGDYQLPLEELEVSDEFCCDCHLEDEHTSLKEVAQRTADREVNPHESHLIGELDCDTCHSMHKASEDYCAECHEPMNTEPGWTTEVSRTAGMDVWEPEMDCTVCHVMVPYFESLEDTNLLAYAHAQEGLECLDCHAEEALKQLHEDGVAGEPIKRRTVETQFCFDCHTENEHTSYAQVIARTADYVIDERNINPHEPHPGMDTPGVDLGPYECSECHGMHHVSLLVIGCESCHHDGNLESCLDCHTTVFGD